MFAEIGQKLAVVEKAIEPWFKELGFEEWKSQTECERLTGKSHEGHFGRRGQTICSSGRTRHKSK